MALEDAAEVDGQAVAMKLAATFDPDKQRDGWNPFLAP